MQYISHKLLSDNDGLAASFLEAEEGRAFSFSRGDTDSGDGEDEDELVEVELDSQGGQKLPKDGRKKLGPPDVKSKIGSAKVSKAGYLRGYRDGYGDGFGDGHDEGHDGSSK